MIIMLIGGKRSGEVISVPDEPSPTINVPRPVTGPAVAFSSENAETPTSDTWIFDNYRLVRVVSRSRSPEYVYALSGMSEPELMQEYGARR